MELTFSRERTRRILEGQEYVCINTSCNSVHLTSQLVPGDSEGLPSDVITCQDCGTRYSMALYYSMVTAVRASDGGYTPVEDLPGVGGVLIQVPVEVTKAKNKLMQLMASGTADQKGRAIGELLHALNSYSDVH